MKRILVAVDCSDISKLVVSRAAEMARATQSKLRLIRVLALPPMPAPGSVSPPQTASLEAAAERSLDALLVDVPSELRDGRVVAFGEAASAICHAANAYDADLVVIGAHRYGILARALGTTAARVVDRSDRPVLVVRPMPSTSASAAEADLVAAGQLMRREHVRLEEIGDRILRAYDDDDWDAARLHWDVFEPAVRAHLDLEETKVLPEFRKVYPAEAAQLFLEHEQVRELLGSLGVRLDLHAVSRDALEELLARVRAHGAREERLYTWMDRQMTLGALGTVKPAAA
jgi:nucleotide-binding universal stress UspA family protein